MIKAEIAGYTYNTENFCPDCINRWVKLTLLNEGYWRHGDMSTEGLLNVLALLWDVDREYADSNDFPVSFSMAQANNDLLDAFADMAQTPRCDGQGCGVDFTGEF